MLRFDNLTGDAGWDWLQVAAQHLLAAEMQGDRMLPLTAATLRDAAVARAPRMLLGYFDRRAGKLHFEVEIEDTARNKMTAIASGEGDPVAALSGIAKRLDPAAQGFSTGSDAALEAWAKGDDERAVALDPDFGPAWLNWGQKLAAAGDPARALDTVDRALARPGLRSPLDRTGIEVLGATLRHDESARAKGLEQLARLTPSDPAPLLALGGAEMNLRRFPDAAHAFAQAARIVPSDAGARNMLGYAEALSGDLNAARKEFEEYGRLPGQGTNALDSLGEAYFIHGNFAEAEREFLEAFSKDPHFEDGVTAWKAAHARWLGGDLKDADGVMEKYWQNREAARDPLLLWRKANWLYETGRQDQAGVLLRQAPAASADLARKQLAVWANPGIVRQDLAGLKSAYQQTDPLRDGLIRTFYAAALLRAGETEQAKQLIARWPLPPTDENLLDSLMYPEYMKLREQLR